MLHCLMKLLFLEPFLSGKHFVVGFYTDCLSILNECPDFSECSLLVMGNRHRFNWIINGLSPPKVVQLVKEALCDRI